MAVRLICAASLHHLKNVKSPVNLLTKYNRVSSLLLYNKSSNYEAFDQRVQNLHEKVYDKDAGFDAQRQTIKSEYLKELERNPKDEVGFTSGRRRRKERVNVSKTSSSKDHIEEKPEEESRVFSDETKKKDELIFETDPDTFGNAKLNASAQDEGDIREEEYQNRISRSGKKLRTKEYAKIIKDHLNARNLKAAINVLEVRMLREDNVKPENYIFNLLISGCAKEGYTRKAFKLFSQMRKRGLKVKPSTYTSLFNACANAPSIEDGLGKATYLRELMIENAYEPNVLNYNSMIKAFGRCGDVKTAYLLADEMLDKKLEPTLETFNFLLQACASDKENGFRHSLLTWHKILEKNFKPDYYTFLSLLRCVRDCSFGDLPQIQEALKHIMENSKDISLITGEANQQEQISEAHTASPLPEKKIEFRNPFANESKNEVETTNSPKNPFADNSSKSTKENSLQINSESTDLEIPNLLLRKPHLGSLVELSEVKLPHDRFLLLGGLNGYLAVMKDYGVTPDIETFTTMLEVIPPTYAAEKQVIGWIRRIGLKADIDFFNILIKKRSMRCDYEGAKEVLSMIRTAGLYPDIVTYGVLALGCQTEEAADELIRMMHDNEMRMNIQILGAMLRSGCFQRNFKYINKIMQISLDERIKPNEMFLRHLHKFKIQCARAIDSRLPTTKTGSYMKDHAKFCDKLRIYYEEQGLEGLKIEDAIKKIQSGPYDHYKEPDVDGVEPLKNERKAKKSKLRKHIKKIKLANLKDDPKDSQEKSDKLKQIQ